jgi:hypothetical protein
MSTRFGQTFLLTVGLTPPLPPPFAAAYQTTGVAPPSMLIAVPVVNPA